MPKPQRLHRRQRGLVVSMLEDLEFGNFRHWSSPAAPMEEWE